jgi:hypothetical protein
MRTWYYARNGRQYGPVGIEEIKGLLGTGGLMPGDLVWREGMANWTPACEIEELMPPAPAPQTGPPPQGGADNPYASPEWDRPGAFAASVSERNDEEIVPGSEPLLAGPCLEPAWRLMKKNFRSILVIGLVYISIHVLVSLAAWLVEYLLGYHAQLPPEVANVPFAAVGPQSAASTIVITLVDWFFTLGWTRASLEMVAGREGKVSMLFGEAAKFPRMVGASLIFYSPSLLLMSDATGSLGIQLVLLAIWIYLVLRYGQYKYAIVEKDMGIMAAFDYSSRITVNSRMAIFAIGMLSVMIIFAGILALIVGSVLALPFVAMLEVVVYRWLTRGSKSLRP